jgi:UDP-N-acetylmuramoyl-tripeptide--D-alanyl-D-alanine ligase
MINDCYNANPDSVKAALEACIARFPLQRKVVVLGEMLELGGESMAWHRTIGEKVAELGIPLMISFGEHAREMSEGFRSRSEKGETSHFDDINKLNAHLVKILLPEDVVLVKGSRGVYMERVIDFLKAKMGGD